MRFGIYFGYVLVVKNYFGYVWVILAMYGLFWLCGNAVVNFSGLDV